MNSTRIVLPEHWTPAQAEAAIELLELVMLDLWQQLDLAVAQLKRRYDLHLDEDYELERCGRLDHDSDDDIPF